ncbi:hypothetical protein QJS10_CPA01g01670 [Acorus calamus]|uniref:Uncharacterized protein n=1 Tax=Acorus calamus TaxID=4465 RepID=A0AAV9FIF7_ACOCL|nr:hypothetical protein QJS10_CPA01g01670 [Acorus calamus]
MGDGVFTQKQRTGDRESRSHEQASRKMVLEVGLSDHMRRGRRSFASGMTYSTTRWVYSQGLRVSPPIYAMACLKHGRSAQANSHGC